MCRCASHSCGISQTKVLTPRLLPPSCANMLRSAAQSMFHFEPTGCEQQGDSCLSKRELIAWTVTVRVVSNPSSSPHAFSNLHAQIHLVYMHPSSPPRLTQAPTTSLAVFDAQVLLSSAITARVATSIREQIESYPRFAPPTRPKVCMITVLRFQKQCRLRCYVFVRGFAPSCCPNTRARTTLLSC
jgi:hypothetical protein